MKLTKDNIQEWKAELNIKAEKYLGKNFADTVPDEEWLETHEGETPEDAIAENLRTD